MPRTKEQGQAQAQAILVTMTQDQKSETIKNISALLDEGNPNKTLLATIANPDVTPLRLLNATCMSLIMNNGDTFEKSSPKKSSRTDRLVIATSKPERTAEELQKADEAAKNREVTDTPSETPSETDQLNETCKTIKKNLILMAYRAKPGASSRTRFSTEKQDVTKYRQLLINQFPDLLKEVHQDWRQYWIGVEDQMKNQNSEFYKDIFNAAVNEMSRGRQAALEPLKKMIEETKTKNEPVIKNLFNSMIEGVERIKIGTSWTTKNPELRKKRQTLLTAIKISLNNRPRPANFYEETSRNVSELINLEKETKKDSTFSQSRHQNNIKNLEEILASLKKVGPLEVENNICKKCMSNMQNHIASSRKVLNEKMQAYNSTISKLMTESPLKKPYSTDNDNETTKLLSSVSDQYHKRSEIVKKEFTLQNKSRLAIPTEKNHRDVVEDMAGKLKLNQNEKKALSQLIIKAREHKQNIKIKGVKRNDKYNKEKGIRSMEINWDDEGNMLVIRSDKEREVEEGGSKKGVHKQYLQYDHNGTVTDVSDDYIHLRAKKDKELGITGLNLGGIKSTTGKKSSHVRNLGKEHWGRKNHHLEEKHKKDLKAQVFAIMDRNCKQFDMCKDLFGGHNILYDAKKDKLSIIDIQRKDQDSSISKSYYKDLMEICKDDQKFSNPTSDLQHLLTMGAFCRMYKSDTSVEAIIEDINKMIKGYIDNHIEITPEDVLGFRDRINKCEALGGPVGEEQIKSEGDRIMGAESNTNLSKTTKTRRLFSCEISNEDEAVLNEISPSRKRGP